MAFQQFTFPQVLTDLGLRYAEADFASPLPELAPRPEFARNLEEDARLAVAVGTEKARSEFMIAPVLLEARRMADRRFGLFSGVELNADPNRGLNGICDFLMTRDPRQFVVTAPIIAVAEAKNDNLSSGLGQCIASLYAARLVNEQRGESVSPLYGVVTTGSAWQFLRLDGDSLTIDTAEYYIDTPGKILGILVALLRSA